MCNKKNGLALSNLLSVAAKLSSVLYVSLPASVLLLELKKTLPRLPFLIGELSGRCLQEVVIVRDGRFPIVYRIVRCRPQKVCRGTLGKIP